MSGWGSFGDDAPAKSSGKLKDGSRLPPIPVSWEMQRVLDQPDSADNVALLRAQVSLSEGNRLRRAGDYFGALMKYERARAAAGELRDGARAAKMDCAALGSIGIVHLKRGDASKAVDHITRALECARANDDRRGEQRWLGGLGNAHHNMSSYSTAIDLFTQALQINRDIGNKRGEGSQLGNLGVACLGAGDYEAAVGHLTQALRISRAVRDKRGESARLGNLGNAQQQMGNYEEAVSLCLQALDISKAIRDKKGEAAHRSNLGFSYAALGDYENVVLHHDIALGMVRATGNLPEECSVQRSLADAYDHTGDYPKAVVHYSNALNIQRIVGSGGNSNKNAEAVAALEKKLAAAKENKVGWDQQQREQDRLAFLERSKEIHAQTYVVRKPTPEGKRSAPRATDHDVLFQFGTFCYRDSTADLGFKDINLDNFGLVLKVLQMRQAAMPYLCPSVDLPKHKQFIQPIMAAHAAAMFCGGELLRRDEKEVQESWNKKAKTCYNNDTIGDPFTFLKLVLAPQTRAAFDGVELVVAKMWIDSTLWCVTYHKGKFLITFRDACCEHPLLDKSFPSLSDEYETEMNLETYPSSADQPYRSLSMVKMRPERRVGRVVPWRSRDSAMEQEEFWSAKIAQVLSSKRCDPATGAQITPETRREKLEKIPQNVSKYAGQEKKLLLAYMRKYNVPKEEQQMLLRDVGSGNSGGFGGGGFGFGGGGGFGFGFGGGFDVNAGPATTTMRILPAEDDAEKPSDPSQPDGPKAPRLSGRPAFRRGHHHTYIMQKPPSGSQTSLRTVFLRSGNWCYEGDNVDLGQRKLAISSMPMCIPILQSQQSGFTFVGESRQLNQSSLASRLLQHVEQVGQFLEGKIAQEGVERVFAKREPSCTNGHMMAWTDALVNGYERGGWYCDKCRRNGRDHRWHCQACESDYCGACAKAPPSSSKFRAGVVPEEFFDLELSPACRMYKNVEMLVSKTYVRGIIVILMYFDGHYYCAMSEGEGEDTLLNTDYPNLTPSPDQFQRKEIVELFDEQHPHFLSFSVLQPKPPEPEKLAAVPTPPSFGPPGGSTSPRNKADQRRSQASQMLALAADVRSDDPAKQLDGTAQIRKLLSKETNPPIQAAVDAGVIASFVAFLRQPPPTTANASSSVDGKENAKKPDEDNGPVNLLQDDSATSGSGASCASPQLQFEAAWALTNIAAGTSSQTRAVIEKGAVAAFVACLSSPHDDVREQAVWGLGNIAGDSSQCRDLVLQNGAMAPLLKLLGANSKLSMLRNGTWTLSNLCKGKPKPPFDWVSPALPVLAQLIFHVDEEVVTDACWALSYLSDGANEKIGAVVESGACMRVVELLMHPSPAVQTPALRTVGNIVSGDELQTQVVINCSALPGLMSLLSSVKQGIQKEAAWALSNITAGSTAQIQAVREADIFPVLVRLMRTADNVVKKEATWAISNATAGGTPEQIEWLVVSARVIPPLCDCLRNSDKNIVAVALEGLDNILKVGEKKKLEKGLEKNPFAEEVQQVDGAVELLTKELQRVGDQRVREASTRIAERFFGIDEDGL